MSDPKNPKDPETGKVAGDPSELLRKICEAIFSRMRLAGGRRMKDGSVKLVPITDGFVWLGVTPAQISKMLTTSQSETDLVAAVAFSPNDVYAIVNARFDGQVRVCPSPDGFVISVTKQNSEPEYLFKELAAPFNTMNALQLLDPDKLPDHSFIFASVQAGRTCLEGWLSSQEACRYAAEADADACGRAPDFDLSADLPEEYAGSASKGPGIVASVVDWLY